VLIDEDSNQLAVMYGQYDGYIKGHGRELASFLNGFEIVNGLGGKTDRKIANDAGCLAAQLISHFKTQPGGICLYPNDIDAGEDYVYEVNCATLQIKCFGHTGTIFQGTLAEMLVHIETHSQE
jgi:hypothetical protein